LEAKEDFLTVKQQDFSGIKHETTAGSGFLNEFCSAPKIVELQIVVKEDFNNVTE
jgi:hypothetical protein